MKTSRIHWGFRRIWLWWHKSQSLDDALQYWDSFGFKHVPSVGLPTPVFNLDELRHRNLQVFKKKPT